MKVLLVDTETTGLPFYGSAHPADAPYQPRMCAIAMALLEDDGTELDRFSALIKPVSWPLYDEIFVKNMDGACKVHGLTFERLEAEGIPIEEAWSAWDRFYQQAGYVCGYNVWFDHKVARGEWKRLRHPIPFRDKQGICLMKGATEPCGIERKSPGGGFKFPKLSEAVQILLGREHVRAHDVESDLNAEIEIYRYLSPRKHLVPEDQPEAKAKEAA